MDRDDKMNALKKLTKPFRRPTKAELYLTNFWEPAAGQVVFSEEEQAGEVFRIIALDNKHPEQATVMLVGKPHIIYLQDWCWAPRPEEMDHILINLGIRIHKDIVKKGKFQHDRPETPEQYVKVIREVRKYGVRIENYFQGKDKVKENVVSN